MVARSIVILRGQVTVPRLADDEQLVSLAEFKSWLRPGALIRNAFRFRHARLLTYDLNLLPRPLLTALGLRIVSRGNCRLEDESGRRQDITCLYLLRLLGGFINDYFSRTTLLEQIRHEITQLREGWAERHPAPLDLRKSPAYLRTDLWFGVKSGGSVGHVAGVLNQLDHFGGRPLFISSDRVPTVREDIKTEIIPPEPAFRDFAELPGFFYNRACYSQAVEVLKERECSFVYQRYSLNNYCGLKLAQTLNLPLVLEYNGSEIWIRKHWDTPLRYERLSEEIELLNLQLADLIVVVSQPMLAELVERGIEGGKILVNPNGVDPERYSPAISGDNVRERYQLEDRLLIGFMGTFGAWHGAEILVEAMGLMLDSQSQLRDRVSLLMIGDGVRMVQVQQLRTRLGLEQNCVLAGYVPQEEGPAHLAACDILVSPHVPNPDGTPFFGSPTKLFEYMAMGKAILASELGQIGEVLEHDRTAWLVPPGDVAALAQAMTRLIEDTTARSRLAEAARQVVIERYTWRQHTERIIQKLSERCG